MKKLSSQISFNSEKRIVFQRVNVEQALILAGLFANVLRSGETLLLWGDIGSGKTFFARGLIQKMMRDQGILLEEVPSPTFTIVQAYDSLLPPVWHLDLFRMANSEEIFELGLEEALETCICLIEWPNQMGSNVPKRNISIKFDVEKDYDYRKISIEFNGSDWEHISNALVKT